VGFRDTAINHGANAATGWLAGTVRKGGAKQSLEHPPDEDRPALRHAEEVLAKHKASVAAHTPVGNQVVPPPIPANLFADVEGHDGPKKLLLAALHSPRPVHVLLVGPPGTGKSQLLQDIAKLPSSRYAVGGATTSSGLVAYLLEKPETRFLVIDELDKADPADLYALYSLMESGTVTRLQHGHSELERRTVWVFAAANDTSALPPALASRFVRLDSPPYSEEQTRQITERVLVKREGLSPARAREIAAATAARSRDPRDGIQVGRLAGQRGPIGPVVDQVVPNKIHGAGVS
jgi:Holliday junction DNA helicase RuvB